MNQVEHIQSRPSGFWDNPHHGLACMNDTEPFIGPVYSYPIRTDNGKWVVNGVFCSLACTKRCILDNIKQFDCFTLFTHMCHVVYQQPGNISPAPNRYQLTKFAGKGNGLSIQEYRNTTQTLGTSGSPPFHYQDQAKLDLYPVPRVPVKGDTGNPESNLNLTTEPEFSILSNPETSTLSTEITTVYPTSKLSTLGNFLTLPLTR